MSEREIRVNQQELHRVHVVRLTLEGRESVGKGAKLLGISARQMKRLRRKMRAGGALGLLHGNRGKPAWNKTRSARVQKVIELAGGRDGVFGPGRDKGRGALISFLSAPIPAFPHQGQRSPTSMQRHGANFILCGRA